MSITMKLPTTTERNPPFAPCDGTFWCRWADKRFTNGHFQHVNDAFVRLPQPRVWHSVWTRSWVAGHQLYHKSGPIAGGDKAGLQTELIGILHCGKLVRKLM
jgi:hypothetical protein